MPGMLFPHPAVICCWFIKGRLYISWRQYLTSTTGTAGKQWYMCGDDISPICCASTGSEMPWESQGHAFQMSVSMLYNIHIIYVYFPWILTYVCNIEYACSLVGDACMYTICNNEHNYLFTFFTTSFKSDITAKCHEFWLLSTNG